MTSYTVYVILGSSTSGWCVCEYCKSRRHVYATGRDTMFYMADFSWPWYSAIQYW